jgi:hypothetical protein
LKSGDDCPWLATNNNNKKKKNICTGGAVCRCWGEKKVEKKVGG